MTQLSHPIAVDFHGARLLGIPSETGVMVPLRPLVEGMGLDWSAQLQRVRRNTILAESVVVITTNSGRVGDPEAVCLPLDLVPGFLFTIDANRVAPEMRAKVIDYQRHCFRVLADVFLGPRAAPQAAMPILPTHAAAASLLNAVARLVPNVGDNYACYWPDLPKALGPAQPGWPRPTRLKGWLEDRAPDLAAIGITAVQFGTAYLRAVSFTRAAAMPSLPEIPYPEGPVSATIPLLRQEERP